MRDAILLTAAVSVAATLSTGAGAAEPEAFLIDTAGDLARLCSAPPEHPNYQAAIHMCHGYLVGVHHFHTAFAAAFDGGLYCIERVEPRPTRDAVAAAWVAWLRQTPGASEKEALTALIEWAASAYPCE